MKSTSVRNKKLLELGQRAVGYIRVSTQGQGDHGIGLKAQDAAIRAFADSMKYTVIDVCKDVATAMGESSIEDRKGLRSALHLAAEKDAWLIVYDWSRLTRHAASAAEITKILPDPRRILDAKTGTNLSEAVKAGEIARHEAVGKEISRRTKAGMNKLRDQGAIFGNPDIKAVQKKGAAGVSDKAARLDAKIADALRTSGPEQDKLTHAQVVDLLNGLGMLTGSGKVWDMSRIRLPLSRARKILDEAEDRRMESLPTFGMF